MKQFRGGLVFKAHRIVCHSTLGMRVITKKTKYRRVCIAQRRSGGSRGRRWARPGGESLPPSGWRHTTSPKTRACIQRADWYTRGQKKIDEHTCSNATGITGRSILSKTRSSSSSIAELVPAPPIAEFECQLKAWWRIAAFVWLPSYHIPENSCLRHPSRNLNVN